MIAPTIHLNGTSAEALVAALGLAGQRLTAAIVAVQDTAPNARDYYPQGEQAYSHASVDHIHRLHLLREVYSELEAMHEAIVDRK